MIAIQKHRTSLIGTSKPSNSSTKMGLHCTIRRSKTPKSWKIFLNAYGRGHPSAQPRMSRRRLSPLPPPAYLLCIPAASVRLPPYRGILGVSLLPSPPVTISLCWWRRPLLLGRALFSPRSPMEPALVGGRGRSSLHYAFDSGRWRAPSPTIGSFCGRGEEMGAYNERRICRKCVSLRSLISW